MAIVLTAMKKMLVEVIVVVEKSLLSAVRVAMKQEETVMIGAWGIASKGV